MTDREWALLASDIANHDTWAVWADMVAQRDEGNRLLRSYREGGAMGAIIDLEAAERDWPWGIPDFCVDAFLDRAFFLRGVVVVGRLGTDEAIYGLWHGPLSPAVRTWVDSFKRRHTRPAVRPTPSLDAALG